MGINDFIDVNDLLSLPREFAATFHPTNIRAKGYPFWTFKGDTSSFLTLFFDNLATQLGLVYMAVGGFGAGAFTKSFIFSHFFGGVGVSLLVGNLYYGLQASKVATRTGNMKTCAQPYGINTPGAIAKTFSILVPALYGHLASIGKGYFVTGDMTGITDAELQAAMTYAWSVACCANFLGGLVEFLGAFIAVFIVNNVPYSAVLVPIAGVGVTWLGFNPIISIMGSHSAHFPIVGFLPGLLIFLSFFSVPRLFGPVPTVLVASLLGIVLFLIVNASGYTAPFADAVALIGNGGIAVPDFSVFSTGGGYFSVVCSLAFTSFIGTFSCVTAAKIKGDVYSPMETMMVDGLGSMIGALCGSPYGTTVYIGHGTYKQFGGTRGYSILNGIMYLIFGLAGFHAIADAILPHEIILGVLVCVGFYIAAQTFEMTPKRWYPAVCIGLALCFSDYMAVGGASSGDIKIYQNGYIGIAILYTWLFQMLIDRWFLMSAIILVIMAALTSFGFLHSAAISFDYTTDGHHSGALAMDGTTPLFTHTWKIIVTYMAGAAMMGVLFAAQKFKFIDAPEEEDYRAKQKDMMATILAAEGVTGPEGVRVTEDKKSTEDKTTTAQTTVLASEGAKKPSETAEC